MCKAMPDMTRCADPWKAGCQADGATLFGHFSDVCPASAYDGNPPNVPSGGGGGNPFEGTSPIPPMRMYFHQDIRDLLLFRSWVTSTQGEYWGALVGVFFMSVGFFYFQTWKRRLGKAINAHIGIYKGRNGVRASESADPIIGDSQSAGMPQRTRRLKLEGWVAARAGLATFELFYSYLLMLVFMAYNWGWCIAILCGCFAGNMMFNRHGARSYNGYDRETRPVCPCNQRDGASSPHSSRRDSISKEFGQPVCC
jgi:hypothetical protein